MLTSVLNIWTPDQGDLYALIQDLAATAQDVEDAILNPPYIRLTNTADASPTSTEHAFQIGPTSGANLIADQNEVMARNGGANAELFLNPNGGDVTIGDVGDVVRIRGHVNSPYLPWAMAAVSYVFPDIASGATMTRTVPLPAGRFTEAPVVVSAYFSSLPQLRSIGVGATSTTGIEINYTNTGGTTVTAPRVHLVVVQMTPTSATG